MFFQRKKKRLLRELWRSRLAKPPSLPLSDYYAPSCLSSATSGAPPARLRPQGSGAYCDRHDGSVGEYDMIVETEKGMRSSSPARRSSGGGAFCLMGHCCGGNQSSTCSSATGSEDSGHQDQDLGQHHQQHPHLMYADEETEEKAFLAFLGKALAQRQLETLLESVAHAKTTGVQQQQQQPCVLIRRQEAVSWTEDLHVIACRMWRWADLNPRRDVLKRIPSCPNDRDPVYTCCNPSHWFRVLQPELPPPPYSASVIQHPESAVSITDYGRRLNSPPTTLMDDDDDSDDLKQQRQQEEETAYEKYRLDGPEEQQHQRHACGGAPNRAANWGRRGAAALDDSSMMTTMPPETSWSTHGQDRSTEGWCSVAYWEQGKRVGPVRRVDRQTVNVVAERPVNDDMCLSSLAAEIPKLPTNATRSKIGAGITISHEGDSMWLYNRSTQPVFVHSLTICEVNSYLGNSSMIFKLHPGYCMRAYNPRAQMHRYQEMVERLAMGPVDVHSVRVSFVKGWGQSYKRQDIKTCPCWLEVILNPCHFAATDYSESDDRFSVDS